MNHDKHEDHDNLWTLLGKARPTKASPAFTRNVLRRLRMEESIPEPSFVEWLRSGWSWLQLAGTATVVAIVLAFMHSGAPNGRQMAAADSAAIDEVVHSADFSVIANLDVLMAMDENDLWLQASAR